MSLLKDVAKRLSRFVGGITPFWAYQRLVARKALGFLYHTVSPKPLPHVQHLYSYKTPSMFESDVLFLQKQYKLPTSQELLKDFQSLPARPRGRPAAYLSFDDGLAECYSVVRPILLRHRIPCFFFIITDCIDNRSLMYRHKISLCLHKLCELSECEHGQKTAQIDCFLSAASPSSDVTQRMKSLGFAQEPYIDQICQILGIDVKDYLQVHRPYLTQGEITQLARDGFVIGAHTRRHPFLGDLAPDDMESEIVDSCRIISTITGEKTIPFAFPFSGDKLDRSFLASLRRKHSIIGPMFDTHGLAIDEPFINNRIAVDSPPETDQNKSNIPSVLRTEYHSYLTKTWR